MFSFHLARLPLTTAVRALVRPPTAGRVPGLVHLEVLAGMELGSPVLSPRRLQLSRTAVFARWEDEESLEEFLATDPLGRRLADGWHVRLQFVRRWGAVAGLADLPEDADRSDPDEPVVAVTVARMRLPELLRFLHWGRPVERLVRDHPGTTLSLAAVRPPRSISTFSIWRTTREMTDMVFGRSPVPGPTRHIDAMAERERRDFHHEFTTLRFRPLSEHGTWEGRGGYVPLP
ncbi:hypothetical protein C8046_10770 [Serinibacter arcticus]|uniref:Spheroidene monooxygenase n=1 Tax=Serinibacter arcticus TaxID=1655435 RepID=A0A2U1ZVR0_9MICO|nr:hypothetical protein [Serinibacter arcticus]PWD51059.1 hypothetical protein C8046_10770 [Serinibacter arcticus]